MKRSFLPDSPQNPFAFEVTTKSVSRCCGIQGEATKKARYYKWVNKEMECIDKLEFREVLHTVCVDLQR